MRKSERAERDKLRSHYEAQGLITLEEAVEVSGISAQKLEKMPSLYNFGIRKMLRGPGGRDKVFSRPLFMRWVQNSGDALGAPTHKGYLTPAETATRLGLREEVLIRLAELGILKLRIRLVRGHYMFMGSDIEDALERAKGPTGGSAARGYAIDSAERSQLLQRLSQPLPDADIWTALREQSGVFGVIESWWLGHLLAAKWLGSSTSIPLSQDKDTLFDELLAFCDECGVPCPIGRHKVGFGKFLKRMAPGLDDRQLRLVNEAGEIARPYAYIFPARENCRARWDSTFGPFPWPLPS